MRYFIIIILCLVLATGDEECNDELINIEHIETVDEMEPTPHEIYIFTDKGKYLWDGKTLTFITEY